MSKPTPTLYAISAEVERIIELLDRTQGEEALMTPEDREFQEMFIEGLRTAAAEKVDGYARGIREHDARAKARREEAKAMAELAAADERRADGVRKFLMQCMERLDVKTLEGGTFNVAVQANGGKQPVDVFIEADKLPQRFTRTKVDADKDAIRDALLAGDPEASAVACLQPRGFSLRIK